MLTRTPKFEQKRSISTSYIMTTFDDLTGIPAKVHGIDGRFVLTGKVRKYKSESLVGRTTTIQAHEEVEMLNKNTMRSAWIEMPRVQVQKYIGGPWEPIMSQPPMLLGTPMQAPPMFLGCPKKKKGLLAWEDDNQVAPHPRAYLGCGTCGGKDKDKDKGKR